VAKKKKVQEAGAAIDAPPQDAPDITTEPAGEEITTILAASPSGESGDAGIAPAPHIWTIEELIEEYFPGAKRVSGGVAAGLLREMRRRNRLEEKGY